MTHHNNHRQVHKRKHTPSVSSNYSDARIRLLLVRWMIFVATVTIGIYCYTKDIHLLYGGTIIHAIVLIVFCYYFTRSKKQK